MTRGDVWLPAGLTTVHWVQSACILTVMCSAAASVFLMVRLFDHVAIRTISVGSAIIVEYVCLRFLGFNLLSAYNRAKFLAIKISGQRLVATDSHPVIIPSNREITTRSTKKVIPVSSPVIDVDLSECDPTPMTPIRRSPPLEHVTTVTVSGSGTSDTALCSTINCESDEHETSFNRRQSSTSYEVHSRARSISNNMDETPPIVVHQSQVE